MGIANGNFDISVLMISLSAGHTSDHIKAAALLFFFPLTGVLLAGRDCDADATRNDRFPIPVVSACELAAAVIYGS